MQNERVLAISHEGMARLAWMFVHPSNTVVILDLKEFLINQKLFLSTDQNITILNIIQGESETPDF